MSMKKLTNLENYIDEKFEDLKNESQKVLTILNDEIGPPEGRKYEERLITIDVFSKI